MPAGAPRIYNRKEILGTIETEMAKGTTLRAILKELPNMPAESKIYEWVGGDEELREILTRAQEKWCLAQIGLMHEIADDCSKDYQPYRKEWRSKNGSVNIEEGVKSDNTATQRARLRVDTRRWAMAKLMPKLFGDKVLNEVSGPNGQPIVVNVVAKVASHNITEHSLVPELINSSEVKQATSLDYRQNGTIEATVQDRDSVMPIESEKG